MGCAVSVPHNLVGEGLSDVIGPEPLFLSLPCCPARINTTTLTIATPAGIVKPSLHREQILTGSPTSLAASQLQRFHTGSSPTVLHFRIVLAPG